MDENKNIRKGKLKQFIGDLPLYAKIFYLSGIVSTFLFVAYIISEPFSDFYNRYIGSAFRFVLAKLSNPIPFSVAEFLLIMLPVIIVAVSLYASSRYADSWRRVGIFCVSALSVVSLLFSMFTFCFAAGYHTSSLDKKLGIERESVSAEELYETSIILAEHICEEAGAVTFRTGSFSVMPYSYEEMNDKLLEAYEAASEKYGFLQRLDSRVKPIMLSELMSYTHITGIYSFFTGEANINVAFPDYTVPYTAAHELAHQRGIAREDEANFVAYLVLIESSDAYIRYSAYLNLYEYVLNSLYRADRELYKKSYLSLPTEVREEMIAYSDFFDKYRDSVVSDVSGAVNDTFLTIQGTEGSKSYGMVVDLAVAYYKEK